MQSDWLIQYPETSHWEQRLNGRVCGVDEAGRGPLVGPLVVAACSLEDTPVISQLKDSKKMTARQRELAFSSLAQNADYCIVFVSNAVVHQRNIYAATQEAMRFSIRHLACDHAIVDAMKLDVEGTEIISFPKADAQSVSVSAASVLAKVSRDLYLSLSSLDPRSYGFAKHKGYGTKAHYEALDREGPSALHRPDYLRTWFQKRVGDGWEPKWQAYCEAIQAEEAFYEMDFSDFTRQMESMLGKAGRDYLKRCFFMTLKEDQICCTALLCKEDFEEN